MSRSTIVKAVERLFKACQEFLSETEQPDRIKKTNPEIRQFIDFWMAEYQKQFNVKYLLFGARDSVAIKHALTTYSLDDLKAGVGRFFKSNDLYHTNNRTIAFYASRVATFLIGGNVLKTTETRIKCKKCGDMLYVFQVKAHGELCK